MSIPVTTASRASNSDSRVVSELLERFDTIWLVRDRVCGDLGEVDVWVIKPERQRFDDGDVMWHAPDWDQDSNDCIITSWSLEEARRYVGNGVPENDRECLRVGADVGCDLLLRRRNSVS